MCILDARGMVVQLRIQIKKTIHMHTYEWEHKGYVCRKLLVISFTSIRRTHTFDLLRRFLSLRFGFL